MTEDVGPRLTRVFERLFGPAVASEILARPHLGHTAWDSIAHINLVLTVEQEFRITFSPDEAGMTMSFAAMKEVLGAKLGA